MNDENAFGILVSFFTIEDEEYAEDETEHFVERFQRFEQLIVDYEREHPLPEACRRIGLGHALYFEFAEDEVAQSPIGWVRELRSVLTTEAFYNVAVVSHGGRWLDESPTATEPAMQDGAFRRVLAPSEPLRRALHAEAACHGFSEERGWGPGLYVDTEAIEALRLSPKNQPTVLEVAGAGFYRLGS